MQNTGRSNFSRSSCQQSQNATPIGYACNVPNPKPYVAVTGCIGGGNANSNSGTCGVGTYQPANGAGAIRGYCSPLVRSAAPKPNGLESSVTKTNIATFVVSSHPNSAVRGLCLPVTVSENLNCSANRKQVDKFKSHFSVQQPFSAACASRLQANFAASSSDASCANTRSLAYRAPNVTQFPNEYLRTSYESMPSPPLPPRPTQWQHQQQQDQSDVLSLIDRFEKLNAFKNEFEIQSYDTTVSCDASVQPQLDRIDPTVCKPTTNCNSNGRVNDAKSWNTNYQAPAYSACNYDVVKPAQPVQCDREVSRTTANHVTFVSANVSRTAAPLASRPTNASDTSNYVYSRNNGNAACDYEYELRRIDCDSACSRRNVAMKRASASVVRTHYPPALFRLFMEQHVEHLFRLRQERLERRAQLEWEMAQMAFDETQKAGFRRMLTRRESEYTRLRRIKLSARDFDIIKMIGVGAFGKVFLVRKCASQAQAHSTLDKHKQKSSEPASTHTQLFAMKKLNKAELTRKNQLGHVKAERDILAESDNEWVVKLYYSFQDARYLYFILEYVPGGDLMSLLIRMGVFAENLARFYVAELILAVESVHAMRFIHRDIKPDNILICADGHLKLTDFGLCTGFRWTHSSKFYQTHIGDTKRTCAGDLDSVSDADRSKPKPKLLEERARSNERAREMRVAYSLVGTPNYIAPEILLRCGYTETVDWWSIGVILYEMLVGQPPFWAATPAATQYKVINHKSSLRLPADGRLSNSALSLIRALVRDPADRLGRNGADEIKAHAFFEPLRSVSPFQQLRHVRAPWQPVITHPTDTSNFDPIDEEALRMLSDEETEDNTRETYADGDRTLDLGLSFEQDAELDGDCALSEQRSASCETLKVIETEETANITLSSVLNVESDSDSGDLACKSVGLPNALDVTQTQCSDRANVPIGTVGKCKRMAKQITDESSVIPPAPYLDFTFRRFFDEPDTQRRANVQQGDHFEYTENFV